MTLALSATAMPAAEAAGPYVLTIIEPVPGYESSAAYGLNEAGQVVGRSYTCDLYCGGTPFLYEAATAVTDLGTLAGTDGGAESINEAGQIVGWSYDEVGFHRAILWSNGELIDIGTLDGGCCARAFDINDEGQIVGWSGAGQGFLYDDGVWTDLGHLDDTVIGKSTTAYAINNLGAIVGESKIRQFVPPFQILHPFIWLEGTLQDLNPLGTSSHAYDINDVAQVVGRANASGVIWEGGIMFALNDTARVSTDYAHAINNNGIVVGAGTLDVPPNTIAFVWENGSLLNLNDLIVPIEGFRLYRALDINDAGQIVGEVTGGPNAYYAAFLLTPVDGDIDGNGVPDRIADFAAFPACMTGPSITPLPGCEANDLLQDNSVDLRDYWGFQTVRFVEE